LIEAFKGLLSRDEKREGGQNTPGNFILTVRREGKFGFPVEEKREGEPVRGEEAFSATRRP